jgi:Cu-Zn family superoxide dismutase
MATFEYALIGDAVYPEGVAFDRPTNSFFVSSTRDGTLFRASLSDPQAAIFSEAGADGRNVAIGLAVDSTNRRLWVAGGPSQRIFVYNIDSGALIKQFELPSAENSFINDVAVDTIGNAYFTDSGVSRLFKVSGSSSGVGNSAEIILDPAEAGVPYDSVFNLNGLAVTPDNQQIILAHSTQPKLFLFTINSGEVVEIDLDEGVGGDGIWLENGLLYSVYRGGVTVVEMTSDYMRGKVVQKFSDPSFKSPTTLAKVGNRLLVVNAQFGAQGSGNPSLPFTVSSVFIPRRE